MERKAFIIFYILIATQSTMTDSASSPSSTSLAEPSSTTPEATETATMSPFTANALLEIRCSETFIPELNDSSSQAFKDRAKHVKDNLETIYKLKYPSFIRAHVLGFRAGSIITTTELNFNSTEDVPSINEIANTLLIDQINVTILNISSYSVTVNNSAVSISLVEPITLPGSSTTSTFSSTASETTMPIFPQPPSEFHSTTESSTTPAGSFTTTTFTTISSPPTASTLISAGSFSPASASSTLSTVETSTPISAESSTATSTLAASSTSSFTSATPSSSAFHATQSSTTPTTTSTTSATLTTTASPPTASTLISAGSFSPASASTVETSTALTTISSTATSTLAPSSITNTGVTTTTTGPTTPTTTKVPTTTAKIVPELLTDLEFHSFDTFTDALNNSESQEFKNRSKLVKDQLGAVYKPKYVNFLGVIVKGFRPGSVITRTQLLFSFNQSLPSRKEIADTLLTAVESGNVNTLNIISQTISVNGSTLATAAASSSASKIESHLLQATGLIIMGKILRLFL